MEDTSPGTDGESSKSENVFSFKTPLELLEEKENVFMCAPMVRYSRYVDLRNIHRLFILFVSKFTSVRFNSLITIITICILTKNTSYKVNSLFLFDTGWRFDLW